MLKNIIVLLLIVAGLGSCLKNDPSETCKAPNCESYDSCAIKADSTEIAAIKNYLAANNLTATQHCSGLFYEVVDPGAGRNPSACSRISVTYTGKLTDGTEFDKRTEPVDFCMLGVITGWTNGLPYVKENGRIRLYIPPTLGYGSDPVGTIPGHSVLVFDVTLKKVY